MAGNSTSGVLEVQSPLVETSINGRGAIIAPISVLMESRRKSGAFSQMHPPWKWAEIMFTGAATEILGSTAISRNVWVPPPDAPVIPILPASTSVLEVRKSKARTLFQS